MKSGVLPEAGLGFLGGVAKRVPTPLGPAAERVPAEMSTTQLLFRLSDSFWGVGALFFGLWLIPTGWIAATSGRFPSALGWLLLVGGVCYVASAFLVYAFDAPAVLGDALRTPSAIGEFWMIVTSS